MDSAWTEMLKSVGLKQMQMTGEAHHGEGGGTGRDMVCTWTVGCSAALAAACAWGEGCYRQPRASRSFLVHPSLRENYVFLKYGCHFSIMTYRYGDISLHKNVHILSLSLSNSREIFTST